jgi:hypothetical protein
VSIIAARPIQIGADEDSQREDLEIRTTAYDAFNHNIRMLNESMGMCIPSMTSRDPT